MDFKFPGQVLRALIFFLILFFPLLPLFPLLKGQAQEGCNIHTLQEATLDGEIQEAVWDHFEKGEEAQGQKLQALLKAGMEEGEVLEKKPLKLSGKHPSFKVTLKNGLKGIFKPYNFWDNSMNYMSEIAAYEVDKLLHLNIVPMTVKKTVDGETGSFQYWVGGSTVALDLPPEKRIKSQRLKFLDYLIRGTDRNDGNYLYKKGRVVAIDHGWTFRPWDIYHQPPWKKIWDLDKGKVFNFLPDKAAYLQLKNRENKDVWETLSPYLTNGQIKDFIRRKDHFIYKVEKWIKKNGEDFVFPADGTVPEPAEALRFFLTRVEK